MRSISIFFLAACMLLAGCRKKHRIPMPLPPGASAATNTLVPGALIKGGGTWTYTEGHTWRLLTTTPKGSQVAWNYEISHDNGSRGHSSVMVLASPSAPWFVYVESPERLWFFNGTGYLDLTEGPKDGHGTTVAITRGKLEIPPGEVPAALIPLLPAELQKLFPAKAPQPPPSI